MVGVKMLIDFDEEHYVLEGKTKFRLEIPGKRVSPLLWDDAGYDVGDRSYENFYCFRFFPDDEKYVSAIHSEIQVLPLKTNIFAVEKQPGTHTLELEFKQLYRYAVYVMTGERQEIEKRFCEPDELVVASIPKQDEHWVLDHIECHDMDLDEDIPFDEVGSYSHFLGRDQITFRMPKKNLAIVVYQKKNPDALFVEVDLSKVQYFQEQYSHISNANPNLVWDMESKAFQLKLGKERYPFVRGDVLLLDVMTHFNVPLEMVIDGVAYEPLEAPSPQDEGEKSYCYRFWPIEAKDGLLIEIKAKNGI